MWERYPSTPPFFAWNRLGSKRRMMPAEALAKEPLRLNTLHSFVAFRKRLHCGELDQSTERSLINFFRWVRLPPPLPLRAASRLLACKSSVSKQAGSDDWSVTSAAHHGLVAQRAERPVVCGRVKGASPFRSASFRISPRGRVQGPCAPLPQVPGSGLTGANSA